MDYRQSGRAREPRVTFVDLEWEEVEEVLAPDFATFLRQLRPSDLYPAYGLVTADSMEAVAAAIWRASGFSFDDLSDHDGYRIFRARLPGESSWAWLTPNKVRRGFVRKGHEEYERLHKLFPELVDRYPEHADCGFFLACTEFESDVGKALVSSLAKLPFSSRPLLLER